MGLFFNTNAIKTDLFDYSVNGSLMTKTEVEFYRYLCDVFSDEYYIFPQVHLSSLVSSKDEGKKGWSAFLHINGKSVDYVLSDRTTLTPVCAIELDDWTHAWKSRIKRDREVERILTEAGMPLVRVKDAKNVDIDSFRIYLEKAKSIRGVR
jgi:hypothetical protein